MIVETLRQARARLGRRIEEPVVPFESTRDDPFPAGAHPNDWRRSGLSRFGKHVCRSFTEALLADVDGAGALVSPPASELDRVVRKMDLWIGSNSADLGRAFGVLCVALEGAPALTIRRATRFTRLGLADRIRVLEALEDHPNGLFSMLLTAFKVPLATAAFEEGEMLASTGFPFPNLIQARPRRARGEGR